MVSSEFLFFKSIFRTVAFLLFVRNVISTEQDNEKIKGILTDVFIKAEGGSEVNEVLSVEINVASEVKANVKLKSGVEKQMNLSLNGYPEPGYGKTVGQESGALKTREVCVNEVMPAMEALKTDACDEDDNIWITTYGISKDVIIMDDLKVDANYSKKSNESLDLKHCTVAIKTLAKFHAMSAVLIQNGRIPKDLDESFLEKNKDKMGIYYETLLRKLAHSVEAWGEKWSKTAKKLMDLSTNATKRMIGLFDGNGFTNGFKVLNRRSFVRQKIWFRYTANKEPDLVKIDWDLDYAFIGSPIFDVQHFFAYSPDVRMTRKTRNTLLTLYHTELLSYLDKFGYVEEMPELEDFQMVMEDTGIFRLIFAASELNAMFSHAHIDSTVKLAWENRANEIETIGMKSKGFVSIMKKILSNAMKERVL